MVDSVKINKENLATSRVLFRLLGGSLEGENKNQALGVQNIRHALHDIMHANISDDIAEKMLAVADEDGSGTVSIEEFKVGIDHINLIYLESVYFLLQFLR